MAWRFHRESGGSAVLVDHASEDLLPVDRSVEWNGGHEVVVKWA
jgi:hypothetical protein